MDLQSLFQDWSLARALIAGGAVLAAALADLWLRSKGRSAKLLPGCLVGSLLSLALIQLSLLFTESAQGPYAMALMLVLLLIGWKALFAPWDETMKVAVLGSFIFWIGFHVLAREDASTRNLHLISTLIALVPAGIWCALFLRYHRERVSTVLLMFFSGMLSTVPILFYDLLVRRGAEFQFFLFRVTPESFSQTSQGFVSGQLATVSGTHSLLMTTLVSFLIVGFIEEVSKFWALSHSGKSLFRSIDDAIEMAIIVAIGFAFAENVINPTYFGGFVRDYLMSPQPDIMGFFSNVLGRSVLTSMVHILCTGIAGYFLGLAVFAGPYLSERHAAGRRYALVEKLHEILQLREITIFRFLSVSGGILAAVLLHGVFNFMVTLPDMLPGNPQTIGELTGLSMPLVGGVPLLILPSMLYVVGGFWLLTSLFLRRENAEDRGRVVQTEMFVRD